MRTAWWIVLWAGCASESAPLSHIDPIPAGDAERVYSCTATPRLLGSTGFVNQLVVGDRYLYTAEANGPDGSGAVVRLDKRSGARTVLARESHAPTALVGDASALYYITGHWDETGFAVRRVPRSGGTATTLYTTHVDAIDALAVAQGQVYFGARFAFGQDSLLGRVPVQGGAVTELLRIGTPASLAVEDDRVYWTELDSPSLIRALSVHGGTPTVVLPRAPIASSQFLPVELLVDGDAIYLRGEDETDGNAILRIPQNGDVATRLVSIGTVRQLAMDEDAIYYADWPTPTSRTEAGWGRVVRQPKNGAPAVVVYRGMEQPSGIAVDERCVYWGVAWTTGDEWHSGVMTRLKQ